MAKERKIWIDLVRGLSMLAILVHHTEVYYVGEAVIDYRYYAANALCCFFFVSGYLFYKEGTFSLSRKLKSVFRTIILPYFIFMSAIALPKAVVHGQFTSIQDTVLSIVLGRESWFITALAIAEIVFALLLTVSRKKPRLLTAGVILSFIAMMLLAGNEQWMARNYWNITDGLMAVIFLYAGYCYHQKEEVINRINTAYYIIPLLLLLLSKYVIISFDEYMYLGPVNIDDYPLFVIDCLLVNVLVVKACKMLPDVKPLTWMGSHVIVYYFLCGGVPLTLAAVANRLGFGYQGAYYRVVLMTAAVYACLTLLAWLIYRYVPWVTGRTRLMS